MSRIPRFYVDAPLRAGSSCVLPEDTGHHAVHVVRLQPGDEITLFNGKGGEYGARIASIQKLRISADILRHTPIEREPPLRVALVQGVSAADRMDFTLRKAVELGVAEIQPMLAARSVARLKGDRAESRQAHWQKVAISACEQCGRNTLPAVLPLISASEFRSADAEIETRILLTPRSELRLSRALEGEGTRFVLAAGPEAGFSEDEEAMFVGRGFVPVSLGPRILRTETAALAALAALNALRGDF